MKTSYPKVRTKRTLADADREIAELRRRIEALEDRRKCERDTDDLLRRLLDTPAPAERQWPIYRGPHDYWPWPYTVTCETAQ